MALRAGGDVPAHGSQLPRTRAAPEIEPRKPVSPGANDDTGAGAIDSTAAESVRRFTSVIT